MMRFKSIITIQLLVLFFLNKTLLSQVSNSNYAASSFLLNEISEDVDRFYLKNQSDKFHSSLKPFNNVSISAYSDSLLKNHNRFIGNEGIELFRSKGAVDGNSISVLPIADLYSGYDVLYGKSILESTAGMSVLGNLGRTFSFVFSAYGSNLQAPNFTDTIIKEFGIMPGNGIAYNQRSSSNDQGSSTFYSFANFAGKVSWSPNPFTNLELGKDKFFIGDGYRSLLLSDVSNNYPYFKTSLTFWKIKYDFWASWMQDVSQSNGFKNNFLNKFGAFHYLSWNTTKWLSISLFENVVWQGTDSNRVRNFDVNYLNPILFFRPVEYSLGSSDNAMIGLNVSIKPSKNFKIYSQLVMDEFLLKEVKSRKGWWANKQGVQAGFLYYDFLQVKDLNLRLEYNWVRPYTYTHGSPQQSYTHFNQPLAHPLGANFYEVVSAVNYKHKKFRLELKGVYALIGKDTAGVSSSNIGQNIFISYLSRPYDYGHKTTQGIKTTLIQGELKLTYYVFPKINMRVELGFIQRSFQNELGFIRETPFVYFGLRTGLFNRYRDY